MIFGAFAAALAGCRSSFRAIGSDSPAESRDKAIQLFTAFADRFATPQRDDKYERAQLKLAEGAAIPSRVWNDTSLWVSGTDSRRTLIVNGAMDGDRYRFTSAKSAGGYTRLADSRHLINLTRLSDDEYAWDTDVGYGMGRVTARDIGRFTGALLASAEGRGEKEMRADFSATIPRTTAVLGGLFRLDSIRTTHYTDGSTLAIWGITMTPAGIEPQYPNFARYVRRYAQTAKMHWTLTDAAGTSFVDGAMSGGRLALRVRTLDGAMVSLSGQSRPMPDSLTLNGDMTVKVKRFTVGFRSYHADFTVVRTEHERSWNIVSRREPEWVLPLITERLLRTPLRRPFQGSGASFRIGMRDDSASAQSILHRRLHLEVQESLILRFLGRLGAIAVGEFSGVVDKEENAWVHEVFAAVVSDLRND